MVSIVVKHNILETIELLNTRLRRQIPFATERALNETAKIVQSSVQDELRANLDRPTPFLIRNVFRDSARYRTNKPAAVYISERNYSKNPNSLNEILAQQFRGGPRLRTRLESALTRAGLISGNEYIAPGAGAKLDQYGNLSRGQVQQLLSQLFASPLKEANRTNSARSRKSVKRAGRIFWSYGNNNLPRGAYIDYGGGIRPLLNVVSPPQYRKRIDMQKIGQRVVDRDFSRLFKQEFEKAVRSAR